MARGTGTEIRPVLLFENSSIGIAEILRGAIGGGSIDGIAVRCRARSGTGLRGAQIVSRRALIEGIRCVWFG